MLMCKDFTLHPSSIFPKLASPWNMLCFKDHVACSQIFLGFPHLICFSQHVLYWYLQKFLKEFCLQYSEFLLEVHAKGFWQQSSLPLWPEYFNTIKVYHTLLMWGSKARKIKFRRKMNDLKQWKYLQLPLDLSKAVL